MNEHDTRRYDMLVRVRDFGAAHGDLFPPASLAGRAFAAVTVAVTDLSQHAETQLSARATAREGTTSKVVARKALEEDLDALSRTADGLAIDDPTIADRFRRPASSSGSHQLLDAARTFVRNAAPLAGQFIAHAMPADFLADLEASIKDYEDAMQVHETGKDSHAAARIAIDQAMDAALVAVRRLEAVVPNAVRGDAVLAAVWQRARRVDYQSRRREAADAMTGAAASPASPASPPVLPPDAAVTH